MNRMIDYHRRARVRVVQPRDDARDESVLDTVFGLAVMALICAAGITLKVLIWG